MPRRTSKQPTGDSRQADYAGQIRREALNLNAHWIGLCSQAYGALKAVLKEEGQAGGICRSLSMAWLIGRKTGAPLLAKLLGPGGIVKTDVVLPMCLAYKAKGAMNRLDERAYIVAQLIAGGLAHTGTEESPTARTPNVADWALQNSAQSGIGQLRMLNVRDGYNHAMAMDLTDPAQPIFFDPNWGEFRFSEEDLKKFIEQSMFVRDSGATYYANAAQVHNIEKMNFS